MKSEQKSERYGAGMMLLANLCFSTGGLLTKFIPWSPLAISGARSLLGVLVIGAFLLITHYRPIINRTVLFGACALCIDSTLIVVALKLTTTANTIILQYSAPIWIILLMALLFHVRPKRSDVITVVCVLIGILCFLMDSISSGGMAGNICALLAGVCYAFVFMCNQFKNGDSLSSVFFGQLLTAILFLPQAAQETDFSRSAMTALVLLGVVQVGGALILFSIGTKYVRPISAALISGLEPILNPLLVAVYWGEMISPLASVGALIVMAAILAYNIYEARTQQKQPAEAEL